MASKIDPAILRALSIDDSTAEITRHGGSGFASTYRITTATRAVFVKTSSAQGAAVMFEGEHASLNAIHEVVPSLCPKSLAWGQLDSDSGGGGGGYFLATEFLDLTRGGGGRRTSKTDSSKAGKGSGLSLAQKLAKLHSTVAPTPTGHDRPQFGFPSVTCCGDTPQPNEYKASWAEFFAYNRLLAILKRAEHNHGEDVHLRRLVEQTVDQVVPRLLADGHLGGSQGVIPPVVVHGDLWSGNKGRGIFVGRQRHRHCHPDLTSTSTSTSTDANESESEIDTIEEEVIYDPSSTYAHSEYDHGIMNMFGGFDTSFWNEYFAILPKTEPVEQYGDRVALYESYHHLNHYAMFGGAGYKGGAVALLKPLVRKYGA